MRAFEAEILRALKYQPPGKRECCANCATSKASGSHFYCTKYNVIEVSKKGICPNHSKEQKQ